MREPTSKRGVALVTGASGGIGSRIVHGLARRGYHVGLMARRSESLELLGQEIDRSGGRSLVLSTDVAERASVHSAVQRLEGALGPVDVAVICAGVYARGSALATQTATLEEQWRVSLLGAVYPILEIVPGMLSRGRGRIGVVTSVDALISLPREAAYSSGKAAVSAWAASLRRELLGTGVTVTLVHPARVDTAMIADLSVPSVSPKHAPDRIARAALRAILRGRPRVLLPNLPSRFLWCLDQFAPSSTDRLIYRLGLAGRHPEDGNTE